MKKNSLKSSLYRAFASSVLMPFIVISLILLSFFNHQLLNSYNTNNRIILQTLTNQLGSSMQNAEHFFLQYLVDTNIARFYQYVNHNEIDVSQENLYEYIRYSVKYRSALNEYLTVSDSNHRGIGFLPEKTNRGNFFYLNKYGGAILRYEKESDMLYEKLEKLASGEVIFLTGSLMKGCPDYHEEQPVFTMLCPVNQLETASRQGYVFTELSQTVFSDLSKKVTLPDGAGMVVNFPDGTPAFATEERFVTAQDNADDTEEFMGRKIQIEGKTHYLYHMQEEKYGFGIDYILPQSTIFREANRTSFVILLFWFCAMAAAFFIFMNLSRRISVSTERIVSYIQKYRLGDRESSGNMLPIPIEEFSEISLAMTEMTERITDLVQHEYIWKMNQQMAEYKAMQAEINPHFFYNVMNSLQALNRIGDTKNLEKGILNLSRMFRYTCEPGYDSSIQKECQFIESYLMLEKVRFEERLYYDIQVEEGLWDFSIPKLLLQPLIENAMLHGMPKDGNSLSILLEVCQIESKNGEAFVWIKVANDGIPYKEKDISTKDRVGITSVRDRLFITYPDSFFWYERKGRFQTVCNLLIAKEEKLSLGEREDKL